MDDLESLDPVAIGTTRRLKDQFIPRNEISQKRKMGVAVARDDNVVGTTRLGARTDVCWPEGQGLPAGSFACGGGGLRGRDRNPVVLC